MRLNAHRTVATQTKEMEMETNQKTLSRRGAIMFAGGLAAAMSALSDRALAVAPYIEAAGREKKRPRRDSAIEALMRCHGLLRRILTVQAELTRQLQESGECDTVALAQTAGLFREIGEDFHERLIEEVHLFPDLRNAGGAIERLVDILLAQHERGRELMTYLYQAGTRGLAGEKTEPLANALAFMARTYNAPARSLIGRGIAPCA